VEGGGKVIKFGQRWDTGKTMAMWGGEKEKDFEIGGWEGKRALFWEEMKMAIGQ